MIRKKDKIYPGRIVGASSNVGHWIRDQKNFTPPSQSEKRGIVIVGGGIAGLSAAWWLKKKGYDDFTLLELEEQVGGNAQSGENAISAYPWGAHYLPLPGVEAKWVRELLQDLGVIESYDARGLPLYNEYYLCADPHERLYRFGRWQEGLVPQMGIGPEDHRQYKEFFSLMEEYKKQKGRDGKRAFEIPLAFSSRDPELLALDRISMTDFMDQKKWDSNALRWYVNYCCRDDYGMPAEQVSAWAGIHYFASRDGQAANADSQTVLTWPEGNGWLVKRLREKLSDHLLSSKLVFSVENHQDFARVDYLDVSTKQSHRIEAEKVIVAAPRFVALRLLPEMREAKPDYLGALEYAPWMVANVSLSELPEGNGAPLCWDNVSYESSSLGYIVATHQALFPFPRKTVITYYLPLDHRDPASSRKQAIQKTHAQWAEQIAADLSRMHPGIEKNIENIDVWIWGHGMISPSKNFIWGEARQKMQASLGRIHFAHSDMSGISIFEEAQYQGIRAAEKILEEIKMAGMWRPG